jgi:hypothetical protein
LGSGEIRLAPTAPDGAVLRVAYAGSSATLGNLMLQNDAIIDAGSDSSSALLFATAMNWAADKFLTVSNSMSGKIFIANTNGVALSRIRAAGFPTYTASLAADGLLVFSPPPPAGTTYDGWLVSAGAVHGPAALLDYAFGSSAPGALDPQYGPSVSWREGLLILSYYVRSTAVGLAVTPELSVDLARVNGGFGPDARITAVSLGTVTTADGVVLDRREARVTMSDVAPKAFLRLRVTQQQ